MNSTSIIRVNQLSFPWQTKDPFLFCAHHEDFYPKGNDEMGPDVSLAGRNIGSDFTVKDGFRMYHGDRIPGFPSHPHRGFETVTIARQGFVDHSDSLGAAGRFGQGDVQWMTAGKGVQHSEMFPCLNKDEGNTLEIFQIWLNLPQNRKMVEPYFSMLWAETIPVVENTDDKGRKTEIRLIAGSLEGKIAPDPAPDSWAANPDNAVAIWNIKAEARAKWTIPASKNGLSRTIYFFKGEELLVEGQKIPSYHSVELASGLETTIEVGSSDAEILLLQGRPLNERVVQYGPFVMNSEEEIRQTMLEFGRSQFGGWPWPRHDNVHDRSAQRFAKYADGRKEEKPRV
jgi:redox-sensitive bicupin YhaK (pirin superfamily)